MLLRETRIPNSIRNDHYNVSLTRNSASLPVLQPKKEIIITKNDQIILEEEE